MLAVQLEHVSKSFGPKKALDDVTVSIPSGRTHVLLGSSGSGKSTIIRILIGVLLADSGLVKINGNIGYVPQDGGLFPHLTGRDNVALVAHTLGWKRAKIDARIDELLALTSLEPLLLDRFPKELSGGQRQRVSLMRAAFLDPALLILDEPLGALDPIIRADVQNELKTIFNALKKTVLMVTHDIDEARFFGHELTLLKDGQVIQTGPFEDLHDHPADPFVTKFIQAQRTWDAK
jgi:osmoprotectant transport system ATP-binding protein